MWVLGQAGGSRGHGLGSRWCFGLLRRPELGAPAAGRVVRRVWLRAPCGPLPTTACSAYIEFTRALLANSLSSLPTPELHIKESRASKKNLNFVLAVPKK
ncbi:hypothetical protein I79_011855 [Cricetulus griseus]|uniref:Uncharacterized protein n=1 Tax=Cricetulus griseus TaxID=10029 RepID=G3HMA4_CRIGR|nr:hypothetical protein I79_011855 [Cricetulus griseus]